jgi:hypothetical protein
MASTTPLLRYQSYGSGGYSFTVRGDEQDKGVESVLNATMQLQEGAWIDASTRAVFVEMFVYSVSKDRLSYVMLAAQYTPSMQVCMGCMLPVEQSVSHAHACLTGQCFYDLSLMTQISVFT